MHVNYIRDMLTAVLERYCKVPSRGIDVQPWFQISTYFRAKADLPTCDKLWMRWCVIRRALGILLLVMTGSGRWYTGDENMANCVNLSKFIIFRMWKVTMAAF